MSQNEKGRGRFCKAFSGLSEKFRANKKPFLLAAAGVTGILLILVSELAVNTGEADSRTEPTAETVLSDYAQELEKQVCEIVGSIDGAGRVSVMLTLDCGEQAVYAQDVSEDKQSEKNESGEEITDKSDTNIKYSYIIIKKSSSTESGLLLKTLCPQVRGAAVVCDGGDVQAVRRQIIEAVSAVLDLSTAKISVSKMAPEQNSRQGAAK